MKAMFTLVCLAMMVSTVSAAVCADTCNEVCDLGNQLCQSLPALSSSCGKLRSFCGQRCGLGCKCTDQCGEKCYKELSDCNAKNQSLDVIECGITVPFCVYSCGAQCVIETTVQVESQLQSKLHALLKSISDKAAAPPAN